ncbi:GDSL-type esterase/lipase family protein [Arthrobacter sp. SAFR-014]|uniref:SGNH/GDSL hydrolase family protein n=1 Tax=unclassified Arthrobacter TaxID=235627 RepID=UPI003F7C68F0
MSRRKKKRAIVIGALLAGVVATGGLAAAVAVSVIDSKPAPVSARVSEYYASMQAGAPVPTTTAKTSPSATSAPVSAVNIAPKLLEAGTKAVIFGDSWTQGAAASKQELGFAYLTGESLKWDVQVEGGSGTSYLNPGTRSIGTFIERTAKLAADDSVQLVIVQGSVNDQDRNLLALPKAAADAWEAMRGKFPNAQLVIMGPATNAVPVDPQLLQVDQILQTAAAKAKLPYISPLTEGWISASNYATYIDVAAAQHPTDAGHAFVAKKTVAALKALAKP